jgi:signal transduction histidine kinase
LQKQRFQSEKLAGIDILASGVAHEINNPLSGIIGMAEIAMAEENLSEIKNYLKDILACSERITAVVKGLRTYSCLAQKEKMRLVDLNEVIEKALKTVPPGTKNQVEVSRDFHPSATIEADEGEIQQVFANLITNAFEAMDGKGGRLQISTQASKNSVEVKVCDDGVGIPEQYVNQIFDPFFTTKKHGEGEGTGLGLNTVYRVVTTYEGTIDVESKEGIGTTFTVSFPKGGRSHE